MQQSEIADDIYTVSKKRCQIFFAITLSNFHQLWWFLAHWWHKG